MKTRFIFNPVSGRNRRRPGLALAIREFISARSLDADLAVTDGPGHATQLAREAVQAGYELVVAVGGDGTTNEVAQGLMHTPTALGLLPCGSGNGLARHLGLPLLVRSALELVSGAQVRLVRIDAATVNGRPFFNAMGLGLDAEVSHRFNGLARRGLPAYVRTAWQAWREVRAETVTLERAGCRCVTEVLLLAIANSDQYGNNARIAPGARVDDGVLDLVAIRPMGIVAAAALASRLFLGNLTPSANVLRWCGARFSIERTAGGLIHTDGEPFAAAARLEVEVLPRSLRVLVPATSRAVRDPAIEECLDPVAFTVR